ncbi:hypothetical protein A2U01_0049660, partial [Trifolium medium]|nr:hypothetical protein [Trifolium medium]
LGGRPVGFRGTSSWWKDVSLLRGPLDSISDWFFEGIRKKSKVRVRCGRWAPGGWGVGVGFEMEEGFVCLRGRSTGCPHGGVELNTNLKCSRYLVLEV